MRVENFLRPAAVPSRLEPAALAGELDSLYSDWLHIRDLERGSHERKRRTQEYVERCRALQARLPPASQPTFRSPLDAARAFSDPKTIEVPPSHRPLLGPAVTWSKRLALAALWPGWAWLIRPQARFNQRLLALLGALVDRREPGPSPELARMVELLRADSQRVAALDAARLGPALELFERQAGWNQQALDILALVVEGYTPSVREANEHLERLTLAHDPVSAAARTPALRLLSPVARELFRRQTRFNSEAMLVLADLLSGRPPAAAPSPSDYRAWLRRNEPPQLARADRALRGLSSRPLISVVVPAYETPADYLDQLIRSLRAQLYPNWELCIVDDGSPGKKTGRTLRRWAKKDPRVRFRRLERNAGIASATNAAIAMARGEWIAFTDHDDLLAPHALAEMALAIAADPSVDWLYSDEDRVSDRGVRHDPHVKPDFSLELLRSTNYVCHLVVARRSLVDAIGGLRDGFQGSQDHDLLLRLAERGGKVKHLAKILYHWRAFSHSLSAGESGLKRASAAGVRAVREHLERMGVAAEVSDPFPAEYRLRYPVKGEPLVSILVPFKDKPQLLERLARTLFERTAYRNFELLLVSNESRDPKTHALLETLTDPRVRRFEWNHPFNYAAINNFAAREAKGELLLFLNNDMEISDPDWLTELVSLAQRQEVGAAAPKLLFPDGSLQHAGVVVGLSGFAGHVWWRLPDRHWRTYLGQANWNRDWLAVTSACLIIRRDLFQRVGGYDERFQVIGSDVDLCLRLRREGLHVLYAANTSLYHHESASRRTDRVPAGDWWESYRSYRQYLLEGDPFYNPNLTLERTDCLLREHTECAVELAARVLLTLSPDA